MAVVEHTTDPAGRTRAYLCPLCQAAVAIESDTDLLVLLHGRGGEVDQVVTADDVESTAAPTSADPVERPQ